MARLAKLASFSIPPVRRAAMAPLRRRIVVGMALVSSILIWIRRLLVLRTQVVALVLQVVTLGKAKE